jgi:ribulose-5-phosphate 4-epimerase/fuculose-1-phosphate aldolase
MGFVSDNMALAEELSRFSQLCYERHLVGAAGGNLSARLTGQDVFLVTASGVALRDVTPGNLVAVDSDGFLLEGREGLRASKEASFHLATYQARPEVNAVIHVHPPYATACAAAGETIPLVTISARLKLKQGLVVPEAPPGSEELSRNVARAIAESPQDTTLLILEQHGLVAYGQTLCQAFDNAELAEDTAKIAFLLSHMTVPR